MYKQFLLNTISLVALNATKERATYKTANGEYTEGLDILPYHIGVKN